MSPTDRFIAETRIRVRYAETDAMGIVHHASYVVYLEESRTDYARQRGYDYAKLESKGYNLAVTELNVRYVKAMRYDQLMVVRSWIDDMKSRTMTFGYEIVDSTGNETFITATSKHICITREGKVVRVPEQWRVWWEE